MHTSSVNGQYGVGFLISKTLKQNVVEFKEINHRIALIRLNIKNKTLNIVQVHAPTADSTEEEKILFYNKLEEIVSSFKRINNLIVVLGDFNGRVGQRNTGEESIMGPYTYGRRNEGGSKIINFSFSQKLKIVSTFFKDKPQNKWTWESPKGQKFQIDYILCSSMKSIKNLRIINKFDFNSDHRLVRMVLSIDKFKKQRPFYAKPKTAATLLAKNDQEAFQRNLELNINRVKGESGSNFTSPADLIQHKYNSLIEALKSTRCEIQSQCSSSYVNKLSTNTISLIAKRRSMIDKENKTKQLSFINNLIRKKIKEDLRNYRENLVKNILESTKSVKKIRAELSYGKHWLPSLTNTQGESITIRKDLILEATDFFRKLYDSNIEETTHSQRYNDSQETFPSILRDEIMAVLKNLNPNKSPGPDGITNDLLITGGERIATELCEIFNLILEHGIIPAEWKTTKTILLHKKGDRHLIDNYRPISLCSTISKVFSGVLKKRITQTISDSLTPDQAGFRKGFSVIDHLHSMRQLIEKAREYNIPVYLCFIDFGRRLTL